MLRAILTILLAAGSVASEVPPFRIANQDAWLAQQPHEIQSIFNVSLSGLLKHVTPGSCPLGNDWSNQTFADPYTNDTLNACYWRPPLDDPNSVIARVQTYNDTSTNSTVCFEQWIEIGRVEGYYFYDDDFTKSFEIPGIDNNSFYDVDSLTVYCRLPHRDQSCNYTARHIESASCNVNESAVMGGMSDGMSNYTLVCEACDNNKQYRMKKCTETNKTDRCPLFEVVGITTCKSCPLRPSRRPPPRPSRRLPPRPSSTHSRSSPSSSSTHSRSSPSSSSKLPGRIPPKALAMLGVTSDQLSKILSMIGGPEYSNFVWTKDSKGRSVFSSCQNIGDGRGITVGIAGFTGSNVKKIIGPKGKANCDYIRTLGNSQGFIDRQWEVYIDEIMSIVPRNYPTFEGYSAKIPLIVGILLDTAMNAGEFGEPNMWGVHELAHNARGNTPKQWATSFLNLRNQHFTTGNDSVMRIRRIAAWMKLVNGDHWNMDVDIRKFVYIP